MVIFHSYVKLPEGSPELMVRLHCFARKCGTICGPYPIWFLGPAPDGSGWPSPFDAFVGEDFGIGGIIPLCGLYMCIHVQYTNIYIYAQYFYSNIYILQYVYYIYTQ